MTERIFTEDIFKEKQNEEDNDNNKYEIVEIQRANKNELFVKYSFLIVYLVIAVIAFLLV